MAPLPRYYVCDATTYTHGEHTKGWFVVDRTTGRAIYDTEDEADAIDYADTLPSRKE